MGVGGGEWLERVEDGMQKLGLLEARPSWSWDSVLLKPSLSLEQRLQRVVAGGLCLGSPAPQPLPSQTHSGPASFFLSVGCGITSSVSSLL